MNRRSHLSFSNIIFTRKFKTKSDNILLCLDQSSNYDCYDTFKTNSTLYHRCKNYKLLRRIKKILDGKSTKTN